MQLPLVVVQLVLVSSTWLMYMCGGGSVNIVLGTFTPAGALGEESRRGVWQLVSNSTKCWLYFSSLHETIQKSWM